MEFFPSQATTLADNALASSSRSAGERTPLVSRTASTNREDRGVLTALRLPAARIKKSKRSQQTKFKVRCQRLLYTLVVKDSDKADKLKQSLPPSMRAGPRRCSPALPALS